MSDDVRDFLDESSGSKYPSFKFDAVDVGIRGKIVERPKVIERPALSPPHDLEKQLIVVLDPVGAGNEDDYRTVWIRKGFMAQAISDAITESKTAGLEIGGDLAIQHTGTKAPKTVGHSPAKLYRAKYHAPAPVEAAVSVSSVFDD
jgi:hypothetical protein